MFPTGLALLDLDLTGLIKHDLPGLGLGLASFFCSLLDPFPLNSHPVFRLQPTYLCHLGGHSWSCPDLFLLYRPAPAPRHHLSLVLVSTALLLLIPRVSARRVDSTPTSKAGLQCLLAWSPKGCPSFRAGCGREEHTRYRPWKPWPNP